MSRTPQRVCSWMLGASAALLLAASCYTVPPLIGPFRCADGASCPPGLLCDDGVCCSPQGQPLCLSHVLDGGRCADGGLPSLYYDDLDQDGVGNARSPRFFCARPVTLSVSPDAGDCNDTPELGASSYPGAPEQCDGLDNDCDGVPDDGLSTQVFYVDQDNDLAGDPAKPQNLCAPTQGYVRVANDCAPEDGTRHPGAPERCNGLDDNCNGSVDEALTDVGLGCDVPSGLGVCRRGRTACVDAGLVCQPPPIRQDECDGLDNDCDGQVDEAPSCGGPLELLTSDGGLFYGAQELQAPLNGGQGVPNCVKDYRTARNELFTQPRWQGTGATSHVFWVESPTGWDLSSPGAKLRLAFSYMMFKPGNPAWAIHGQPVVYLCDSSGGHVRYVHFDGGSSVPAMTAETGAVDELIPLAGNPYWVIGANANLDIKHVQRVEVLIQPADNADGGIPTFSIDFKPGFGFVP